MNLLSRSAQIFPDKNVNVPCTNAAFTLPPEPTGFVVLCQLAQRLSILCGFCPPDQVRGRLWLVRLHSGFRRFVARPCLRLVLLLVSISVNNLRFSYGGLSPHKFTPCQAYTKLCIGANPVPGKLVVRFI